MKYILSALLVLSSYALQAQANGDAILGTWKTGEGNGHVEIFKNGTKYQGKIVWLKEPNDAKTGKPKTDTQHPDKANHSRPIMGLVNLWGFTFNGKQYENGRIYDPKNGKEYKCVMTLKDANTLDVRGFVGITLIGRTDTWTRVK
jgi:uncharacterized protein (DUF2147 family)